MTGSRLLLSFVLCVSPGLVAPTHQARAIDRLTFKADFAILYPDTTRNLTGQFGYHGGIIRIDWNKGKRIVWFVRRGGEHVTWYPDERRSTDGWQAEGVDQDAAEVILWLAKAWYQYQDEFIDGNFEPMDDFELTRQGTTRINGMTCRTVRFANRQNVVPPLTLYAATGLQDLLVRFDLRQYPVPEHVGPVAFELSNVSTQVDSRWFEPPQPN